MDPIIEQLKGKLIVSCQAQASRAFSMKSWIAFAIRRQMRAHRS